MQDNSGALLKRVGALGAATALAVSGAFMASPAFATPTAEPDATSADTPAAVAPATGDASAATEALPATMAPGLAEALLRDLGMTVEEFEAAGELGKKAADALPDLQDTEGFIGVAIEDGKIVITGSGEALAALALELDAALVAPAEVTEGPAEEASDAPSVEATDEPTEEVAEETATTEAPAPAKVTLPGNYVEAVAELRADYVANVGVQGLQSIMWDGAQYVISVDSDAAAASPGARSMSEAPGLTAETLADKYHGVRIDDSSGAAAPLEDVVNGQGYAALVGTSVGACSIGFNGFNAEGAPAVITAGHCTVDGAATATILTIPADDPAAGGEEAAPGSPLGTFGFSQFGGTGNAPITSPPGGNIGTDIAVINDINSSLDLLPEVTQWEDASDLTAATTRITGVADPVVGAPSCKSGRTTGWSCGTVTAIGEFYVEGHQGTEADARGVLGFESTLAVNAAPGDSGGPTISGETALGIISGGGIRADVERMFSTSLTDGLGYLGGYSVALFVADPTLTSHQPDGTVLTDETISGTAPAGSTVKLTRNDATVDLAVTNGTWSFAAPSTVPAGSQLKFQVQAVNGYSESKTVSYDLKVKEAPLAAPVITNPAHQTSVVGSLSTITGTGTAGATVSVAYSDDDGTAEVDADWVTGTATVGADGTWEWKLPEAAGYGSYKLKAVQTREGKEPSSVVDSTFQVIPATPAITSITDGQGFTEGSSPRDISGTGTAGAELAVTIGETTLTTTVADNGSWEVNGFQALSTGSHTVNAVQTLEEMTSDPSSVTFTVTAADIVPAGTVPGPDTNGDGLPDTGASGVGLIAAAGALLMAGGIGALLINRRRQTQDA